MRTNSRETAWSLALKKGHHKIIGFIDNYVLGMFPGRHVRGQGLPFKVISFSSYNNSVLDFKHSSQAAEFLQYIHCIVMC